MDTLYVLLVSLALVISALGFERYRTDFITRDLVIALLFAGGIVTIAVAPTVYDRVGYVFGIQHRTVTLSLLVNVTLTLCVLYLMWNVHKAHKALNELTQNVSVSQAPKPDGGTRSIAVVIPAYNEAETIGNVLESLPEMIDGYLVTPVVVSDGSEDETASVAETHGAAVVEHPLNQGQGGALRTGFKIACRNGASIVVTMDGDGQHPATELERFVSPIIDDEADFVVGSRYRGRDRSGNSLARQTGIRFFTNLINVLTKMQITDCTNGYRAIRRSELERLTLTEEQFNAPELIIEARKKGLRIKEVPVTVEERLAGETKKPKIRYALGLTRAIIVTWLR